MKDKCIAVVLAAGHGKRMNTSIPKQFLELHGRPILFYSLNTFQESKIISEIILVTGKENIEFCRSEIVEKYGLDKVTKIIAGGSERYNSVYNSLQHMEVCEYVFIHDGARPFIDKDIIERTYCSVKQHRACVAAMPVKDTIKIADDDQYISHTPQRKYVWSIQTPQVFEYNLIKNAYEKIAVIIEEKNLQVTDDAMVVESVFNIPIKLVEGSYKNIKITTPEDLKIAEVLL